MVSSIGSTQEFLWNTKRIFGRNCDTGTQQRRQLAQQTIGNLNFQSHKEEALTQFCAAVSSLFDSTSVAIIRLIDKQDEPWGEMIAGWKNNKPFHGIQHSLQDAPYKETLKQGKWVVASGVQNLFSTDQNREPGESKSYAGICLHDSQGNPTALLTIVNDANWGEAYDAEEVLDFLGAYLEKDLQRFEIETELRSTRKIAEQADKSKTEFLANMSHEIRNPMTTILGYTELLGSDGEFMSDPVQSVHAIQSIQKSGHQLLCVINDILDASKIDAGNLIVELEMINPVQVIESVYGELKPSAVAKGLDFRVEYLDAMPELITSDASRFHQSLSHLVSNAIKFTEQGSVTIAVSVLDNKNAESKLKIDVNDTGIGLSEEQKKKVELFQPFAQVDGSSTRKHGGIGLGLRIANSLAEMLGGGIQIVSRKQSGSTFSLSVLAGDLSQTKRFDQSEMDLLGQQIDDNDSQTRTSTEPLKGKRILVAEDGKDNQKLIAYHLKKAGAIVQVAADGQIAIEAVAQAEEDSKAFDLLLMDMQMPVLDGYNATRNLREQGCLIPIIALTANAMDGDRIKCIVAGCDDYISKPIESELLINLCASFMTNRVEMNN